MPNLTSVLRDEISRLARKEIRKEMAATVKASAQHRRDIAALKRQVQEQARTIAFLQRQEKKRIGTKPPEPLAKGARFVPRSVKAQRDRLGLSAENYGKLVGVSGLSIYKWELGESRPRDKHLAALVAVRGIGKRGALKRLEMLGE